MVSKVAIVHDYLTQHGGAERVVLAMASIFPGAPIYTSMYAPNSTFEQFKELKIHTTLAQKIIPARHFRLGGPLFGSIFARLDLSKYDKVLISTSGFAHHVRHDNGFVYCHTPPRFLYDLDNYFANHATSRLVAPLAPVLSGTDRKAAKQHEHYLANSLVTQQRIRSIYDKEVDVVHPPLNTSHLPVELTTAPSSPRALVLSRLKPYKRIDIAIKSCAKAGVPLTIAGSGPEERTLKEIASRCAPNTTQFLGNVDEVQSAELFRTHSLVLMPGVEDFGLASIEASYAGRPVIATKAGGALESVQENITGLLVADQFSRDDTVVKWAEAIKEALSRQWDPAVLRQSTLPFQFSAFENAIRTWMS